MTESQAFINFSRSFQPPSFDNMVNFDNGAGVSLVYTPPAAAKVLDPGNRHARRVRAV